MAIGRIATTLSTSLTAMGTTKHGKRRIRMVIGSRRRRSSGDSQQQCEACWSCWWPAIHARGHARRRGRAMAVAAQLRSGQVHINSPSGGAGMAVPFGGYKQSGDGREWGLFGLEEFVQMKAIQV